MPAPIISATLQAAALSTASNICAQWFQAHHEHRTPTLDLVPLLHFVTLAFITVPPNYVWQQFLEQKFPAYPSTLYGNHSKDIEKAASIDGVSWKGGRTEPGGSKLSLQNTILKWFIDCITVGAIFNTLAFLIVMGILKCEPTWQIWHNIQMETIPIILAGYKMWPFASLISFSFVPVHRRIVWLSFCGFLWGIYMSLVAARV